MLESGVLITGHHFLLCKEGTLEVKVKGWVGGMVIEYNGEVFKTYKELAERYNIQQSTLSKRMKRGCTLQEAVELGESKTRETYVVNGEVFRFVTELANNYNLNYMTFISKKLRIEGTVDELINGFLDKRIEYKGKSYNNMGDLAREYQKSGGIVLMRLKSGWSLEDALNKDIIKGANNNYNFRGEYYCSVREMSEKFNISGNFINNLSRYGLSIEESLELVLEFIERFKEWDFKFLNKIPRVIYRDVEYSSLDDFTREIGVKTVTEFRGFGNRRGLDSDFETAEMMKQEYKEKYKDNGDSTYKSISTLKGKYKKDLEEMVSEGIVTVERELRYPDITFERTGLCIELRKEYDKFLVEKGVRSE